MSSQPPPGRRHPVLRVVVVGLAVWLLAVVAGVPPAVDALTRVRGLADDARTWASGLPLPDLPRPSEPGTGSGSGAGPGSRSRAAPGGGGRSTGPGGSSAPSTPTSTRRPAAVTAALDSVVEVFVQRCTQTGAGSGFAVGSGRIMTNAHVVQGASQVEVDTRDGRRLAARVVRYDPRSDVAVLAVDRLYLRPLGFAGRAPDGTRGWVAGHPLGGPLRVVDATVQDTRSFGDPALRSYVLRATVRPGNSGGPLLDRSGDVLGLVYARAARVRSIGLARIADVVADDALAARSRTAEVAHGSC